MSKRNQYHNYDLHPATDVTGYHDQVWAGKEQAAEELKRKVSELTSSRGSVTVCMDLYPGVDKEELLELGTTLSPVRVFDMEDYAKDEETLNREFGDYITDDRVFGILCHKKLECLFDSSKLAAAKQELEAITEGTVLIVGVGAGLLSEGDLYVYGNITRWEIQLRYRNGMPNWHCTNTDAPILSKVKRGFFIEWRLADRHKKVRYDRMDYILDTEVPGQPVLAAGEAFRAGLSQTARKPFRMEPYFDPGVWGGQWMKEHFGLDQDKENFAWSFDGVPEENSINLRYGSNVLKIPAMDLVLFAPHELLGERVHGRFGAEFPIRFDLLDTMGGGNLSLQVHPLTEYIQDTFGMHYTQDESYYILDADETEETYVYLGVKNQVDRDAMKQDLKAAERGEKAFPAEQYVNKVPVKKHDHILIPAGTIHCSGKNTMVLEISATPYIFTFKLWDWGRLGMDGLPRPIHVDHGMKNIQWDRDTDWIYDQIVGQQKTVEEKDGYQVERTGLHNREFIDTYRYTLTQPYTVIMEDSVHMMNLVDGSHAWIESTDGSFEPFEIHYAETAIVPAAAGQYRIVPEKEEVKIIIASVRN